MKQYLDQLLTVCLPINFDIYGYLMYIDINEELEIIHGGIGIMDRCISFIYTGGCKLHNQIIIGVEMELVHTEHSFNTSL